MKKIIKFEEEKNKIDKYNENSKKDHIKKQNKKNKKKVGIIIAISILIMVFIIVAIIYGVNKNFRNFMDKYILGKNVTEENLPMIDIDYNSNTHIIPYGNLICVLTENTLFQYNSSGKQEKKVKIEISNPIYDVEDRYLVMGEKNNQKLYLISDEHIVWEKEVDGNLSKVTVNKNGYVCAIVTGTTHKSVIIVYDSKGNELFKSYLSQTIAVDACISPDNQELAYAEVNTSGTVIQSSIKIILVDSAKEIDTEPKYTYTAPQNTLVLQIKYQDKNKLICMYENSIHIIENGTDTEVLKLEEEGKKINFADINLDNHVFRAVEKSTGLFNADTVIEIKNIQNQKETVYTVEEVTKNIVCNEKIIGINLGTQVDFIDTNGWLVRRYISSQVIEDIVIGNGIAGIIYADKIELISL